MVIEKFNFDLIKNSHNSRMIICVQGLGYVGAAMAIAVADARGENGDPYFNVIGVDLPNPEGLKRITSLNSGKFPFHNLDDKLSAALKRVSEAGNLFATADDTVFRKAEITLVAVNLDLEYVEGKPNIKMDGFRKAIRVLGNLMPEDSLVIIETTVPPGTCEKIISKDLAVELRKRDLPSDTILIAHSFERVMPGKDYFESIINNWRVYSGLSEDAVDRCGEFLSKVINVKDYPLTQLPSTTASEIAKVLENSYRAMTIAFIEEWGRFAEDVNVDLFKVIAAIRKRPSHSNIRQPGFGVGAVINSHSKIGVHCIINTSCSLDHDNIVEDFAGFGPKACTGGMVSLGYMSYLGIGSIVKHGITIGKYSVIGGGSYVNKDVSDNTLGYGVPFRKVRSREKDDKYL